MWALRQEAARSREVESEKYLKDKEQIIEMASGEKREFFRPSGAGSWGRFWALTPTRSLAPGISEEPHRLERVRGSGPGLSHSLSPFPSRGCPEVLWTLELGMLGSAENQIQSALCCLLWKMCGHIGSIHLSGHCRSSSPSFSFSFHQERYCRN